MTQTQTYAAPGWYLDPDDPDQERYWNGGSWQPGSRPASVGAQPVPDAGATSEGVSFESRMLDLAAKQLAAQERATLYLGWMLALMVALIAVGIVAGLLAR